VVFVLRLAAPTIKHLRRGQVFDRFITTSVTVIVDQLQNLVFKKTRYIAGLLKNSILQ